MQKNRRWHEKDQANVSVESSTLSDWQQRKPEVHSKNLVNRTVLPADDWQQNTDAASTTYTVTNSILLLNNSTQY